MKSRTPHKLLLSVACFMTMAVLAIPLSFAQTTSGTTSGTSSTNSTSTSTTSTTPSSTGKSVNIQSSAYNPYMLVVNQGDTVTWTNQDSIAHTVTSDTGNEMNSGNISPNGVYTHTFNSPGIYDYHCAIHPSMKGTIEVSAVPTNYATYTVTPSSSSSSTNYTYPANSSVTSTTGSGTSTGTSTSYQCTSFDSSGFCTNYAPTTSSGLPYLSNSPVPSTTTNNSILSQGTFGSTTNTTVSMPSSTSTSNFANATTNSCLGYDTNGNCINYSGTSSNNSTSPSSTSSSNTSSNNASYNSGASMGMMRVVTHALHIRSSAAVTRKNIIGYLKKGDIVSVIMQGTNNRWCQIDTAGVNVKSGNSSAWVACRYLAKQ